MNRPLLVSIFLGAGVLTVFAGCAGVLAMRTAAARLHFVTLAGLIAPLLFMAAVLIEDGFSQSGWSAIQVAAILVIEGPILAQVAGRAIYNRQSLRGAE